MSRLEELIQELCPDGVEYRKLGDIADVSIGLATSVTKYKRDSGVLLLHNSDIQQGRIELKNIEYIDDSFAKKNSSKLLRKNDIITVHTGDVGTSAVITDEYVGAIGFTTITSRIKDFNQVYPYYLSTYFNSHKCKMDIRKMTISDRSNLNQKDFIKIQVPVPPLEVQREIVRILDSFTLLTAELTAELTARKKQYEYYEHNLLFDDKYKRMKLSDLCTVNQGLQIPISKRLKEPRENCYRYITVQFLKNNEDEQYYIENPDKNVICKEDDILVTRTGSTGVIVYGVEGCFHNNFFKVTPNELIHKKYMYFLLRSKYMYNKMLTAASGGTVPDLPHKKFYALKVPVPTIDEQKHIVEMLEKFNELSKDVSIGLPAEIEARQKQYEFYRDKLLSFKQL